MGRTDQLTTACSVVLDNYMAEVQLAVKVYNSILGLTCFPVKFYNPDFINRTITYSEEIYCHAGESLVYNANSVNCTIEGLGEQIYLIDKSVESPIQGLPSAIRKFPVFRKYRIYFSDGSNTEYENLVDLLMANGNELCQTCQNKPGQMTSII